MLSSRTIHLYIQRQRGAAFIVMLVILVMGITAYFVSSLSSATLQIKRDEVTAYALAQAKDALIGYAVTYGDTHPNQVNGFLPLPDLGTSRNNPLYPGEGNTAGNFSGNSADLSVIGRLPWLALDITSPQDGNGECLWYAISGTYQNALKTDFMNWDTYSQFDTYTSNGTSSGTISTTGTNYHQRPVAIIFSAGAVLSGQVRTTSTIDTVTRCGGNYDARNYLDTFTANSLLNSIVNYFTGSTNSSTGTFTLASPKQLVIGPISDASGNTLVNDRFLTITSDDIFRIIKKRNDFGLFVSSLLSDAVTCMSAYPSPITINFDTLVETSGQSIGNLIIGRMPNTVFTGAGVCAVVSHNATRQWRDNLLYAICNPATPCLTVNGAACTGIVVFAGERTSSKTRETNADKNTWSNYLEDAPPFSNNLTAFSSGLTSFSSASLPSSSYSSTSTSTDILACVP